MGNIIVLDLETLRSADDCRNCGRPEFVGLVREHYGCQGYRAIGWGNKPALGLSIGGYYSYRDDRIHWFDEHNLEETMIDLVDAQPTMVSFNGIQFDFPLMRGILRRRVEAKLDGPARSQDLTMLCDAFKELAATSYDILAEIWDADPARKFEKGLNSLDAISRANGLGSKLSHGAQAPRDWADGKYADVLNYCQDDILKTKALFEKLRDSEGLLKRGEGETIRLRWGPSERLEAAPMDQGTEEGMR